MILNRQANMKLCLSYQTRKSMGREMGSSWRILLFLLLFVETTDYTPPRTHTHYSLHFSLMVNCKFRVPCVLSAVYIIPSSSKEHCSLTCLVAGLSGFAAGSLAMWRSGHLFLLFPGNVKSGLSPCVLNCLQTSK